jgi:hypothetical protein
MGQKHFTKRCSNEGDSHSHKFEFKLVDSLLISSDRVSYIVSAAITPMILAVVVIMTAAAKVIVKECICEQALYRPRTSSRSINPTGTTVLRSCD